MSKRVKRPVEEQSAAAAVPKEDEDDDEAETLPQLVLLLDNSERAQVVREGALLDIRRDSVLLVNAPKRHILVTRISKETVGGLVVVPYRWINRVGVDTSRMNEFDFAATDQYVEHKYTDVESTKELLVRFGFKRAGKSLQYTVHYGDVFVALKERYADSLLCKPEDFWKTSFGRLVRRYVKCEDKPMLTSDLSLMKWEKTKPLHIVFQCSGCHVTTKLYHRRATVSDEKRVDAFCDACELKVRLLKRAVKKHAADQYTLQLVRNPESDEMLSEMTQSLLTMIHWNETYATKERWDFDAGETVTSGSAAAAAPVTSLGLVAAAAAAVTAAAAAAVTASAAAK